MTVGKAQPRPFVSPAAIRISGLLALVALWEGGAQLAADSFVLAGPGDIATHLFAERGLILRALVVTGWAAFLGFVYGNLAAVVLAVIALAAPRTERLLGLLALLIFCLPLVATGPILRVLFGTGTGPQITLAALAVYYTTFLALMVGLRAVPGSWSDLERSFGRGRSAELIYIRAAASVPYFVAGLQIAAPAAFLGAMFGEFTGAERGLGVLTIRAIGQLDVTATWAIATVAALVSMLVYGAVGWLGRRIVAAPPELLLNPLGTHVVPKWRAALWRAGFAFAVIILLWWGSMEIFALNRFFAKRPDDIWSFLLTAPDAASHRQALFGALWETFVLMVPGYVTGLALGAGLAVALVLVPALASTVLPVAIALRSVPIVTTAPLLVLALGRGALGTITIVAIMIFFPTLVACLRGLRQTPGQIVDVFDSYASGRVRLLLWARLPAMLPAFFASARMAVPAAVLAATTAEWLATGRGIGSLMALTASTSNYNMLWSAVVVLSALATLAYLAVEQVERQVLRVYASEQIRR